MGGNQIIALAILVIVGGFLLVVACALLVALHKIVRRMARIIRRRRTAATERPLYDPEPPARMPAAPDAQRRAVQPADADDDPDEFLRIVRAEFTDYGHNIADHYDTTGD